MTSAWQAGHLVRTGCSRNCWAVIITPGWAITVTLECPAVIGWYPGWYPATLNKVNKYKAMFFAWIKYYRNKTAKRKKTKSQTKSQDSIYQPIYDFIKYTHLLHWYWKKQKLYPTFWFAKHKSLRMAKVRIHTYGQTKSNTTLKRIHLLIFNLKGIEIKIYNKRHRSRVTSSYQI